MPERRHRTPKPLDNGLAEPTSEYSELEVCTREYFSKPLSRSQPYACYRPAGSETSGRQYPLLVLLHGATGCWRDWGRYTRLARYLAGNQLIVVCPDGGDGWYTNAVADGERREDDIMNALLPHLEATLPIVQGGARAIGGLSMGGYGAVKLALKYPGQFQAAVSHSGAFDITTRPQPNPVYGDLQTSMSLRRQESVYWLAEQALCRLPTNRTRLYIDCGLSDPLLETNRNFSAHLNYIGYGHTYREMPGHHTWPYWDRAFRTGLPDLLKDLNASDESRHKDVHADETGGSGADALQY
jgi:putative tributyrin esterase